MKNNQPADDQDPIIEPPVKASNLLTTKKRFGAPAGPRQHRSEKYDGRTPLEWPGHEATAEYLATPKALRQFKNDSEIAKHFQVGRMTIFRWKQDLDVIKRAHFLTERNQMAGDLLARKEWPNIMHKMVDLARKGDLRAAQFCESRAWQVPVQVEESRINASISISDIFSRDEVQQIEELRNDNLETKGENQ